MCIPRYLNSSLAFSAMFSQEFHHIIFEGQCLSFMIFTSRKLRTLPSLNSPYIHDCVYQIMVFSYKAKFSSVADPAFRIIFFHHNRISSWINGRFTGLLTSIFRIFFSVFSILDKVILVDQSQITTLTIRCTWSKCRRQKHNVTSRRVFTHRCSCLALS